MTTRARDFYEARRAEPVPRHQGELAPPARGGNCAIAGRGQPLQESASTKPEENASYTNAIDSVLTAAASVAAPALRHLLSEHRSDHLPHPSPVPPSPTNSPN